MSVDWNYYNKFEELENKYLPSMGEGENMASQIVTAVSKLVYKWYNDGDVYDNTHCISGWCNDLSSYANWLVKYTDRADVLYRIAYITTDSEYEDILKKLTDDTHDAEYLEQMAMMPKEGSIYDCDGEFVFSEEYEDEEEDW